MRKLVRPGNFPKGGPCGTTEVVNDPEFVTLLREKLVEEALEAERAGTVEALTEELGDILEVVFTLAVVLDVDPAAAAVAKRKRVGGFGGRLVWTV
jgi:predicted house-cleaning noncanonical NTP pyrophosphatase (MazG superfamily)